MYVDMLQQVAGTCLWTCYSKWLEHVCGLAIASNWNMSVDMLQQVAVAVIIYVIHYLYKIF